MRRLAVDDKKIISEAITALNSGGLIVFPTETCYGVGVAATNSEAVKKLLSYKHRPEGKAISIAVADKKMAEDYVELNSQAQDLYQKFLPGPFTIISRSKGKVAKALESEVGTLGIRIPDYPFMLKLLKEFGKPITATSANSAGKKTPYSYQDVLDTLSEKQKGLIDLFLDAGELPHHPSSTVIDTTRSDMQILRAGSYLPLELVLEKEVNSEAEMKEEGYAFAKRISNCESRISATSYELLATSCTIVLFDAELGAGKTQFTKGMAKGLGITELVKSPTYSLIEEYEIKSPVSGDRLSVSGKNGEITKRISSRASKTEHRKPASFLVHFDAWRLENLAELGKLGLENYIKPGNIIAVEWSGGALQYFLELQKKSAIEFFEIKIDYLSAGKRLLRISKGS
ncbi:MAG: L-threonylcarbamoyladenylate synthase [bacterium]